MSQKTNDVIRLFEEKIRTLADLCNQTEELVDDLERFYELIAPSFYKEFRYWDFFRKFQHTETVIRRGVRCALSDATGLSDVDKMFRVFD